MSKLQVRNVFIQCTNVVNEQQLEQCRITSGFTAKNFKLDAIVKLMGEYGCNVCNEKYSSIEERCTPRVLTGCGHTICQGCAQSIFKPGVSHIICPFDRIKTAVNGGEVRNLKKNFALLELIEKIQHTNSGDYQVDRYARDRLLGVDCDEDPCHTAVLFCTVCESHLCESPVLQVDRYARDRLLGVDCDEDPCHTAVLFCTVCESHLCERCSNSSHDTNVLSKHRRIPLSEKPASAANCRIHNSYRVEFVCKVLFD
ncbi:hypothetical protein DICVIV_04528 [Dictyocaulus viviparus]|uniref:B-box zinc finger n=1 Tax=Dictyocaulus viviparus TaxID=29172 RepID=A0A0D8XXW3_DICVI|nr:hypothetical protein DICVIV_04528 [Dictyocaulus viviparus]